MSLQASIPDRRTGAGAVRTEHREPRRRRPCSVASALAPRRSGRAFSLLELLVVIGVMTLLLGMLMPGLASSRAQALSAVCRSNIRQLAMANDLYAQEWGGIYVPGAADFLKNLNRWHGERSAINEPFRSTLGPLVPYLGPEGAIRACPGFAAELHGFEAGNGGYGYNNAYIGVHTVGAGADKIIVASDRRGAWADRVKRPAETLMFADSAFVDLRPIEYSFAEPRFHPQFGTRADPSIHFRHRAAASVAWCDTHVSSERRTFSWSSGLYEGRPERFDIGWFGVSDDNSLFDLQ